MSATIYPFTIGPIREPDSRAAAPGRRDDSMHLICSAGEERLGCVRLCRDDAIAGAEHRIGAAAPAPITALALLHERRGFLAALGSLYGFRPVRGFRDIVYVRSHDPSPRFLADPDYRLEILNAVAGTLLDADGLLALRPLPGPSRPATPALERGARRSALQVCRALGASGFAQLCDDALLHGPPPLFVRPWRRAGGLMALSRPPSEAFSETLCVQRLGAGRMVLVERY